MLFKIDVFAGSVLFDYANGDGIEVFAGLGHRSSPGQFLLDHLVKPGDGSECASPAANNALEYLPIRSTRAER